MDCRECESYLAGYVLGELEEETAASCRLHLEECECCRQSLSAYEALRTAISDEPVLVPSAAESAGVAKALTEAGRVRPTACPTWDKQTPGLFGFVLASIAAFVVVAAVLASRTFSLSAIVSSISPQGLAMVVGPVFVIVFVTSFIPIVITARRRPLNGLTFRR